MILEAELATRKRQKKKKKRAIMMQEPLHPEDSAVTKTQLFLHRMKQFLCASF